MMEEAKSNSEICRLCLENGDFQSIFNVENDMHYAQKVMVCASVEILPEDHMPSLICHPCILSLNSAYNFKKQCEHSDRKLRLKLGLINVSQTSQQNDKLWIEVDVKNEDLKQDIKLETEDVLQRCSDDISLPDFQEDSDHSLSIPRIKQRKKIVKKSRDVGENIFNLEIEAPKPDILNSLPLTGSRKSNVKKTAKLKKTRKKIAPYAAATPHYECSDCSKVFRYKSGLIIHVRRHTGERPWACPDKECEKSFISASECKRHRVTVHTDGARLPCPVCGRMFSLTSGLRIHMRTHTGEKPYQCKECGARFTQPGTLRTHSRRHSGEHPFVCDVCGNAFTSHGGLARHKRTHTGERRAQCTVCGKKFVSVSYLPEHMRQHTGEKPFACKTCGKCFALSSNLSIHERLHAAQGAHVCPQCGKACTDLKTHLRSHSDSRPYACPYCDKKFKQSGNLKYHITIHTNERKFACQVCNKMFKTNDAVKEHSTLHTGEKPHKCVICDQSFRSVGSRRKHIRKCHGAKSDVSKKSTKKKKNNICSLQNLVKTVGIFSDDIFVKS